MPAAWQSWTENEGKRLTFGIDLKCFCFSMESAPPPARVPINDLTEVVRLIEQASKILVLTGAGMLV